MVGGVFISLVLVTLIFFVGNTYYRIIKDLPSIDLLPSLVEPPNGSLLHPSQFYDRTQQHIILTLENPAAVNKQYIELARLDEKFSSLPIEYLVSATIASDDPEFWDNSSNLLSIFTQSNQTTIPQKLIEIVFPENSMPPKEQDLGKRLLALQLVGKFGHLKILEWYLNTVQYGKFIYGVDAAARAYFAKPAQELSLAEAAMLAAFEQNPSLDPSIDLPSLREMQVQVIFKMRDQGFISSDEAQEALKENIQFQPQLEPESLSPEFTNLVLQQLSSVIPLKQLYRGGFEIVTSLDFELQNQADCVIQTLQIRTAAGTTNSVPTFDPSCEAGEFLSISPENDGASDQNFRAGVVIMDPENGQVLAMVGDENAELIPSYPKRHQVGTIISPWLYLTAFTQGMSPASLLWDIPVPATGESSNVVGEANQSARPAYHGPVSLRAAFVNDFYGAAEGLYQQVGAENIQQVENKFGIRTSEAISETQLTIDDFYSQQVSLFEIVQAFGVLANQGFMSGQPVSEIAQQNTQTRLTSNTVLSVTGINGKKWLDQTNTETIPVVSTQLAYLSTQVLSDAEARQLSTSQESPLEIDRPVAVKTGRSLDESNIWTVGFTPQIVVGVWIGESQPQNSFNPELASDLWQAIIRYATQEFSEKDFTEPSGISHVMVCEPSGLLPSPICPSVKEELFLTGLEPTKEDDLYKKYWVNRETGLLATIFTPVRMVEQKVYMSIPAPALEWARQSGFPLAPVNNDTYPPPPPSQEAEVNDPIENAYVGGLVNIYGSAGGEDFAYYRLQVGKGVYPQEWVQLGEDNKQPLKDGLLGVWDTTGLDGEYLVELLVVKNDRQFEQAYLYVTVDNTAPQVQILSPEENEEFHISQDATIIIRAAINDDFGLGLVEFEVDDQWKFTLYGPPYLVLWPAQLGMHEIRITAYDLAGNHQEEKISFIVTQ